MANIKRSVDFEQIFDWDTTLPVEHKQYKYKVTKTTNLTEPNIGECLNKAEVEALIDREITVNIRPLK